MTDITIIGMKITIIGIDTGADAIPVADQADRRHSATGSPDL